MRADPALLASAVAVVRKAAVEVMSRYKSQQTVWDKDADGATTRSAENPLTEADLAADRVLREGLLAVLPEAGWLSEETADDPSRLDRELVWIVDPIDGTREYVEGVDQFAISVALVEDGVPSLGILLNPATNILLTALRGEGIQQDGEPIHPRHVRAEPVLLASRTEMKRGEFAPFEGTMEIRAVGSTAWKLGLAACGEGDAYFTRAPRNEWDIAAGVLLCREAGLTVTDLLGVEQRFNRPDPLLKGVVAAIPSVHSALMAQIHEEGLLL